MVGLACSGTVQVSAAQCNRGGVSRTDYSHSSGSYASFLVLWFGGIFPDLHFVFSLLCDH